MLDSFLEVACEHEKKASAYQSLVADMRRLPKAELQALASGRSKLASLCPPSSCGSEGDSWLSKFEGTPLHEQALALEQQSLEMDIAREQRRLAEAEEEDASRAVRDEEYRAEDAVRLKKRILDLELNKLRLGESSPEVPEEGEEGEEAEEVVPAEELEEEPGEEESEEEVPAEELEEVEEDEAEEEALEEEEEPPPAAAVKKAAARMRARLQKVAEGHAALVSTLGLRKEALGVGAALSGGFQGLRSAAGQARGLWQAGAGGVAQRGLGGLRQQAGNALGMARQQAPQMMGQAAEWAKQNPGAALGAAGILGAGTLGAGALGGGALGFGAGRGTARR